MPGASPELNHVVVRAGAGAGKTTGLVRKVSEVYEDFRRHGLMPRIVLTTFTRKATQELKERLIQKACRDRDPEFLQFVSDPSRLQISTIHGLLNIFLRQVGHLAGLDSGFQIINGGEATRFARQALREAVLEHPEGLALFESYGFDRVLQMCEIFAQAWREQGGLRPASLEELEASAQATFERFRQELTELSARVLEEVEAEDWRDFALALREFAKNWDGDARNLEALPSKPRRSKKKPEFDDWQDLAEDVLNGFKDEMKKPCWNKDLWPTMIGEWSRFATFGEAFLAGLERLKDKQAVLEMSDLELKALEVLRAKPFLGQIFAENWDFWMIDEYQDTSPLQVEILKLLIGGSPRYVVGDPQQSIYLFRGAEVGVFDKTQAELVASGGEFTELKRNWRSQPDLLSWINDFMASLSPAFVKMLPREGEAPQNRDCVLMIRASDERGELESVVARVGELVRAGARLEGICVLGRTHKNLMAISTALRAYGYPTHIHAARGFSQRREVLDALSLWKFLVNPHDNLNLAQLLRSPWFFVQDAWLAGQMEDRPRSLWLKLQSGSEDVPGSVHALREAEAKSRECGLVRAFEETLCSAAYIDLCLHNDPAGRKESNLWKLIMKARQLEREGGASMLDLIDAEELADPMSSNEGDASSAQEPNCIHLMTIHGSKGLEFDHVILARMGENQKVSHTPPLQAENGAFFFSVPIEDEGKFVPSPMNYVLVSQQQAREREEFDRWLYVALTRAKETLTLTWSEVAPNSWASRSEWFQKTSEVYTTEHYRFRITEMMPEPTTYERSVKTNSAPRPRFRGITPQSAGHRSVTELVGRESKRPEREDLIRRWEAQSRGTRIHKALESLKYKGRWEGEFDAAIEYVLNLSDPPVRELIQVGSVEWGFQVKTETGLIEGQIDLWAKWKGRIFIIDYKSGSPTYEEEAFRQLSLYGWALRQFGHKEPIEMVVVYPLREKIARRDLTDDLLGVWESKLRGSETAG